MTKHSVRARQLQQPAAATVEVRIPINRWHEYINPSTVEVQLAPGNSVVPPRVAAAIMLVAGMSQYFIFRTTNMAEKSRCACKLYNMAVA